ncbi:hypothetical protein AVEN_149538-1 [Araneus ventricosus]|uniref:Uncharacterized protein n=1 Tax=Araneus ventricosus TaxID=182803 RepID=A0A4Y2P494_ARAVE|nr:hypothetical protein AVEN_149538-1 [Araneus ventricosus]
MLTLQEKALLVKLFYLNQQNSVAAVKEFRRMKQIRRCPMFPCALRKMIWKFETTGKLGILPGRGRKEIPSSGVEDGMPQLLKPAISRLMDGDSEVRTTFELEFLARMVVDITWPWNILWSDEVHFCLIGHVNTHNCRIWAAENPHAIQEHPDRVTVWCGFTATFIIGPYFLKR